MQIRITLWDLSVANNSKEKCITALIIFRSETQLCSTVVRARILHTLSGTWVMSLAHQLVQYNLSLSWLCPHICMYLWVHTNIHNTCQQKLYILNYFCYWETLYGIPVYTITDLLWSLCSCLKVGHWDLTFAPDWTVLYSGPAFPCLSHPDPSYPTPYHFLSYPLPVLSLPTLIHLPIPTGLLP